MKAAGAAEKVGQYEKAVELYQRFLSSTDRGSVPLSLRVHARTRLATSYFLLHRYQQSLDAVAPLTHRSGKEIQVPAQAWLVEGLDYLELDQPSQAISSLGHALALNPESGTARLAMGDALVRTGRLNDAIRVYEEQTRRTPSGPDGWYKLGLAYAQRSGELADDYARRIPESVVIQQLLAKELLAKGDESRAAAALFRLLRQAPEHPEAHADLGAALLDLGYAGAAENHFRRELSYDPDCPLAQMGLAEIAALQGEWEHVIAGIEGLARRHPHELVRLFELPPPGPIRAAWSEAKMQIPPRFAGSPVGKLWDAWLNNQASPPQLATVERDLACSKPPSEAMAATGLWLSEACYRQLRDRLRRKKTLTRDERIKLTEAEFRLGRYRQSRQEAQRILQASPENAWGGYWLSQASGELAEECFSKVTSLNPESARVHQMLAQYFATRHNFPRAKAEYLAAIESAPELPDLHIGLGSVYLYGGEWQEAEKEFRKTLELTPGSAYAHYQLGDTYIQLRRWGPAAEHLRKALEDPAFAVRARLDLAKAEEEMGEVHRAVEELSPVLGEDPDGEIHYRLAGLYRKLGEKDRAREALTAFKRLRNASLEADRSELQSLEEGERPDASQPNP